MEQKKLLIVDDDPAIREVYAIKFKDAGYGVETAADSKEALKEIAEGFKPSAILLDIIMPGANGLELLDKFVNDKLVEGSKIVIFSNLDQKADLDDDVRKKICDYLLKVDFTPAEMVKKIDSVLAA